MLKLSAKRIFCFRRVVLCTILLSLLPVTMPGPKEQIPTFDARVDLVSLDVEVLDAAGNPATDLVKDDFIVKEDGTLMPIMNFSRLSDRPVSSAILLDTSAIELEKLSKAKQFIIEIIHRLGHDDDICLYSFDNRNVYREVGFTKDRTLVTAALDNISTLPNSSGGIIRDLLGLESKARGPHGILHELFGYLPPSGLGVDLALQSLREGSHSKRALIFISNRFRGLGPATVEHVQNSGCTLMTLGFTNKTAIILSVGDLINKRQFMRESGGRQFSAETDDITGVSRSIVYSLKNYYSIGYQTKIIPGDERPRHIKVSIPRGEYAINARRSYIPKSK